MGTVIINGKTYDAMTGMPIADVLEMVLEKPKAIVAESTSESVSESSAKNMPVARKVEASRRLSKQDRLAAAVAQEFAEPGKNEDERAYQTTTGEAVVSESAPEWISSYVTTKDNTAKPNWISNYLAGNEPVEIEPIGLEVAPQSETKTVAQTEAETASVKAEEFASSRSKTHNVRRSVGRSKTLSRAFVKKPKTAEIMSFARHAAPAASVAKHPDVHRFAPVSTKASTDDHKSEKVVQEEFDAPYFVDTARKESATEAQDNNQLKNALINEQLEQPIDRKARRRAEKQAAKESRAKRSFRAPTLITAALAIVVIGGYFTYVNMPAISIRVAAREAGIDAHVPYTPNGYLIDGPVAYAAGQIKINYKSNGGASGYSVTQQSSDWSNEDIVNGLLRPDESYRTIDVGDVTVYRYNNNAAWVKDDMLFTVNGNDTLGDSQIAEIAKSM